MIRDLKNALADTLNYLAMILKALQFWRRDPPVVTFAALVKFVETRSKFVSQITLYSYIKTRAGTRYTSLFEDEVFATSINIAKWEVYLACLCDLASYAAASAGHRASAENSELGALAIDIVGAALKDEEIPPERPQGFDDIRAAFEKRVRSTRWRENPKSEYFFLDSLSALVEWAPIADELKIHDIEIVKNSMRFKWKKVRDQLDQLLDAESVLADWRSGEPETRMSVRAPEATAL